MFKKLMIMMAAALISVGAIAQNKEKKSGLNFLHVESFKEAQKVAEESGKILMVDIFATWCGPCQMLMKNVFPSTQVESLNSKIVAYKVDAEKGEGPSVAKAMGVRAYPTLIFFKDGQEIARMVGAPTSPAAFVEEVNKQIKGF